MRRSLLFMSGNNPSMMQNSDVFGSDAVIYDLEDAVSITEKDSARLLVKNFLENRATKTNQEIVIRINGLDTDFYPLDLDYVVSDLIDTIMLPKASYEDVVKLDNILSQIEKNRNMKKHIGVIPIIELAKSVIEVEKIATGPRVNGILLGAEDLCSDLEVQRTKLGEEILYPRAKVAIACKTCKIDAIDTPFTDINDPDGLENDTLRAKGLGMNAKAAIHPKQTKTINKLFTPTEAQITWSLRVLKATENARKQGLGVFSLDSKMIDKPIIERAEKVVKKAIQCGVLSEDALND